MLDGRVAPAAQLEMVYDPLLLRASRSRQWLGAVPAARCVDRVSQPPAKAKRSPRHERCDETRSAHG
jgi:hypothetical protein